MNLFVAQMIDEFEEFGIFAEEMMARVAARLDAILLVIAVHAFFHALEQETAFVARNNFVPLAAPNYLDDVPACATEKSFKFLDNFSVATHRAVEPLQIAVDDPDQIIQAFTRAERDCAERFRLVRFAVADEAPDFCFF